MQQDFGDLTTTGRYQSWTYQILLVGLFMEETIHTVNNTDFITTASTGNAQDFGDLTTTKEFSCCFSPTRGIFWFGGSRTFRQNRFVQLPTTGNGISFGDLAISGGKGGGFPTVTEVYNHVRI